MMQEVIMKMQLSPYLKKLAILGSRNKNGARSVFSNKISGDSQNDDKNGTRYIFLNKKICGDSQKSQ